MKYLSVRQYTLGIVQAIDSSRFTDEVIGTTAAVVIAAVVFSLFALLTVRRLMRMDVP